MPAFWTGWNSLYPRCVDSRPAVAFVAWQDGAWRVEKRGDDARTECGPQFPGASLLFVRALEVIGGRGRWRAFDIVERASAEAGWGLQLHLDDDLGSRNLNVMTDAAIIALAQHQHTGCGFAEFAWGRAASMVVSEAKRRHWRVQFLTGEHNPRGAWINPQPDETFDTAQANAAGTPYFNVDAAEARAVFALLESMIHQPGFAQRAEAWMIATYRDLVQRLGAPSVAMRPAPKS